MTRGITGSGFIVTRWKVKPEARRAHDWAVRELLHHTKIHHPGVTGLMCLRRNWDEYLHIAHIGSFSNLERISREEETPECEQVWENIRHHMVPGTMEIDFWAEVNPELWKPVQMKVGEQKEDENG